jgi:hypothetical protein
MKIVFVLLEIGYIQCQNIENFMQISKMKLSLVTKCTPKSKITI